MSSAENLGRSDAGNGSGMRSTVGMNATDANAYENAYREQQKLLNGNK